MTEKITEHYSIHILHTICILIIILVVAIIPHTGKISRNKGAKAMTNEFELREFLLTIQPSYNMINELLGFYSFYG